MVVACTGLTRSTAPGETRYVEYKNRRWSNRVPDITIKPKGTHMVWLNGEKIHVYREAVRHPYC